ncbi:hypothetical protein GOP47_0005116, partial [Adiantum capillus-veneris]
TRQRTPVASLMECLPQINLDSPPGMHEGAQRQLRLSISRLSDLNSARSSPYVLRSRIMDAQVSLSASFTYQDTCSDELHQRNVPPAVAAQLLKQVGDTSRAVTVALAMADTLHHRISP